MSLDGVTPSLVAFSTLLGLVGLSRLAEVVVSLRRLRGRSAEVVVEPVLLPFMVLLHVALVVAPPLEVVALGRSVSGPLLAAAALALALSTALRIWTLRALGEAWNVGVVRPADALIVTTGPFAWIRHPNYLVVIVEVLCLPLLHGAWLSALGLSVWNALVLARRIHTEEAALAGSPAWRAAMLDRPRLVPDLR
jgi:methyltransferase